MKYISFLLIFFITSCKVESPTSKIKTLMGKQYLETIKFPEKLEVLNGLNKGQTTEGIKVKSKFYLLHFFTADCDRCIEELKIAQNFINKNPRNNLEYIFLSSAPSKYFAQQAIEKLNFQPTVYFEKEYWAFKRLNELPLDNKNYDTMLINKNNQVILFGAFYNNPEASKLLKEYLDENT